MENSLLNLLGIKLKKTISKNETLILEVLIHIRIYYELKILFGENQIKYECDNIMEGAMFDGVIIRKLANELVINEEYTIKGLAAYTGYPEDVIYDLVSGININPTIALANKIIELHVTARKELYSSIMKDLVRL